MQLQTDPAPASEQSNHSALTSPQVSNLSTSQTVIDQHERRQLPT
ncbi:hypothetical protein [Ignatzschineria ureiclastica]|nr:hypothetical protein [Ignatzschineria ureiclastica]